MQKKMVRFAQVKFNIRLLGYIANSFYNVWTCKIDTDRIERTKKQHTQHHHYYFTAGKLKVNFAYKIIIQRFNFFLFFSKNMKFTEWKQFHRNSPCVSKKSRKIGWKKFPRCCWLSFELCKEHRECKLHKLTSFAQVACIVFLCSKSNLNVISTPVAIYIEGGVWLWKVLLNNTEANMLLHCISSKQQTDDINCAYNGYDFIIPVVK